MNARFILDNLKAVLGLAPRVTDYGALWSPYKPDFEAGFEDGNRPAVSSRFMAGPRQGHALRAYQQGFLFGRECLPAERDQRRATS